MKKQILLGIGIGALLLMVILTIAPNIDSRSMNTNQFNVAGNRLSIKDGVVLTNGNHFGTTLINGLQSNNNNIEMNGTLQTWDGLGNKVLKIGNDPVQPKIFALGSVNFGMVLNSAFGPFVMQPGDGRFILDSGVTAYGNGAGLTNLSHGDWLWIAAKDTVAAYRANADVVCDGVNDADMIYTNLASLAAGRNALMLGGHYSFTNSARSAGSGDLLRFTNWNNHILAGQGMNSTFITNSPNIPNMGLFDFLACTNVTVMDMTIDGNLSSQTNTLGGIPIAFQSLSTCPSCVSDSIVVRRMRLRGSITQCLAFAGVRHGKILDCDISQGTIHPFEVDGSSNPPFVQCYDIEVQNNWIHDNFAGSACHLDWVYGVVCAHNTFDANLTNTPYLYIGSDDIVAIGGGTNYGGRMEVVNNLFLNGSQVGITCDDITCDIIFAGNEVDGILAISKGSASTTNLQIANVRIENNSFWTSSCVTNANALSVDGGTPDTLVGTIKINDNFFNCLSNISSTILRVGTTNGSGSVAIRNNTFANVTSNAVITTKMPNTSIEGNRILGISNQFSGQFGIVLDATSGAFSHTNRVVGNAFYNITIPIKLAGSCDNYIAANKPVNWTQYNENGGDTNCDRNVWDGNVINNTAISRTAGQGINDTERNIADTRLTLGANHAARGVVSDGVQKEGFLLGVNSSNSITPYFSGLQLVSDVSGANGLQHIYYGGGSSSSFTPAGLHQWYAGSGYAAGAGTGMGRMSTAGWHLGEDANPTATLQVTNVNSAANQGYTFMVGNINGILITGTNQSVGIGTKNPQNTLDVMGTLGGTNAGRLLPATISGAGNGNTNYTLISTIGKMYLGSSNVNISAVMNYASGSVDTWEAAITNLSANTWGITFSAVTNRWKFYHSAYGTNAPTVLTNNTLLILHGESEGTNTLVKYEYYAPAL